jgi:hypothetical protein
MVRINRWTAAALAATFLSLTLVVAGIQVVQAEPQEAASGQTAAGTQPPASTQSGRKAGRELLRRLAAARSGVPVPISDDSYFRLGYNTTLAFVMEADATALDPRDYDERDQRIGRAIIIRYNQNWHWSIGDGTPQHQLFRQGTLQAQADLTLARKKGSDAKERVAAVYKWWETSTKWTAEDWKTRKLKTTEIR